MERRKIESAASFSIKKKIQSHHPSFFFIAMPVHVCYNNGNEMAS